MPAGSVYVPGSAAPGLHKLASNEMPLPPPPAVLEAVERALHDVRRYPSPDGRAVAESLAAHLEANERYRDLGAGGVLVGNGSVALVRSLFASYVAPGDAVLTSWRSFEAYPVFAEWAGAIFDGVALDAGSHDVDALVARLGESEPALVLLTSPNNPGGASLSTDDVRRVLAAAPARTLVVLDHAYAEFDRLDDRVDPGPLLHEWPNLLVLRTMSKAYSLAGVRVGYAIGHPDVVAEVRRRQGPFEVNLIAEVAALASIRVADEVARRCDAIAAERDRTVDRLLDAGLPVGAGQGNFVWLHAGSATPVVVDALEAAGFAARAFADEGVRVTIDEPAVDDAWSDAIVDAWSGPAFDTARGTVTAAELEHARPRNVATVADQRRSLAVGVRLSPRRP